MWVNIYLGGDLKSKTNSSYIADIKVVDTYGVKAQVWQPMPSPIHTYAIGSTNAQTHHKTSTCSHFFIWMYEIHWEDKLRQDWLIDRHTQSIFCQTFRIDHQKGDCICMMHLSLKWLRAAENMRQDYIQQVWYFGCNPKICVCEYYIWCLCASHTCGGRIQLGASNKVVFNGLSPVLHL